MGASLAVKRAKVKKHSARPPTSLQDALLAWYDMHRRAMPWRALHGQKANPYHVWLSEVMLQQTTVATVGAYFQRFTQRWPVLDDLAAASLDDVLRMWAGLGYYRRARMLHQCAQKLRDDYKGVIPSDEKTLLALPGFGAYTAAAVRAIAFDKPANVVDGNVERVIARLCAIQEPMPKAKPSLRAAAAELVPQKRAGDYAQALMDLGATVCTPRSPKCPQCPWIRSCQAQALGIQETLPRRVKAKAKPVRRAMAFVLFNANGDILIRRRPSKGLLADMMEVPSSPWVEGELPTLAEAHNNAPVSSKWKMQDGIVTHIFTHFTLEVCVAVATVKKQMAGDWIGVDALDGEALPSVMKKIIQHAVT